MRCHLARLMWLLRGLGWRSEKMAEKIEKHHRTPVRSAQHDETKLQLVIQHYHVMPQGTSELFFQLNLEESRRNVQNNNWLSYWLLCSHQSKMYFGGGQTNKCETCEKGVFPKHFPAFTKMNWPNNSSTIQSMHGLIGTGCQVLVCLFRLGIL